MLEEYLSTVTVSSLTGEVKDIGVDEGVGFSGEKKPEVVENTREDAFHCRCLLSRITFQQSLEFRKTLGIMPLVFRAGILNPVFFVYPIVLIK